MHVLMNLSRMMGVPLSYTDYKLVLQKSRLYSVVANLFQ